MMTTQAVWFLIGAALVFFMQCGFAMVETGFTRAKNAGNIIMKNLMDFCIGTVVFILIGFGLLFGEDTFFGIIGKPNLQIFKDYANFDWSNFVFNLVFCATTATIVSGAMAERTKFISYCIYSAIISAVVYPIEAHWVWGGGWLAELGFHDFAGSAVIHMVGGVTALIGATFVGARIGKFTRDKNGKVTKVNAFPGHSLTLGALGCFILWFGWYGFNGAACYTDAQLASVFVTTTIAPAVATVVCMIFTWLKYGKPDVSMCLNASLAGLVAITAGCDVVTAFGSIIIGAVAGLLVNFGVWLLDHKLHIDDPVGAVAVHMMNGIWGTIAVGLFAAGSKVPECTTVGLFYGGMDGFKQLGIQLLGVVSICAWTVATMCVIFLVIKKTIGLRVSEEEEIKGLDLTEHGIQSAYADFVPTHIDADQTYVPQFADSEIPTVQSSGEVSKMSKVVIMTNENKFEMLKRAMNNIGVTGMTVTRVQGCGMQKGGTEFYRGVEVEVHLLPKIQVEIVVCKIPVETVVDTARKVLYTGSIGDGKIFVYNVEQAIKIRTGETGYDALQDE